MQYQLTINGEPSELAAILAIAVGGDCHVAAEPEAESAPAVATAPDVAPATVHEPEKAPSIEDVRSAMMAAIDNGKRAEVSDLLAARGCKRITDLPESERAAFLADVRGL